MSAAITRSRALGILVALAWLWSSRPALAVSASQPPALPAPTGTVINVSTLTQLQAAVQSAAPNSTIMIAPGTYVLTGALYLVNATDVTIRGATNNRDDVVLTGQGMTNANVPFGIWTNSVRTTIANLTIRDIYYHPIIINPAAQAPRIYNVHLINAGEQFIKVNPDDAGGGVNNGIVEYSVIEYETTALNDYTNGVDVHTGSGWIVRNNLFRNITAPAGQLAGPTVLFWNHSSNNIVEGNTFIDCQRDISFGLIDRTPDDNVGGIIRNNFIYRRPGFSADVPIYVGDSANTQVLHNTVLTGGTYGSAIEYRFAATTGTLIANNLVDGAITARDGASGTVTGNYTSASASMFVNPAAGDLHLLATATAVIDKLAVATNAPQDFDGDARPQGGLADYGADEFVAAGGGGLPTAPVALVATSPVAGRVDLRWTDTSANETRFEIAQDDTLAVRQSPAANVTAATFTGLITTTAYRWYVRACNNAGCSPWRGPVAQPADGSAGPPAAPTNLVALSPLAGRVDLTWTDTSANETRFEIAQDDTLAVRQSPAANVTTATLTGLSTTTAYRWYVRACNPAGCSAWAGPVARTASGPSGGGGGSARLNVALASNGATASASSSYGSGYGPGAAINGDRKGLPWGNGGGWKDGTAGRFPDWLQVDFSGPKTINEVDVFSLQDGYSSPVEPTSTLTFSRYGLTDFQVQYWNGTKWLTVPGGTVKGNKLVRRQVTFGAVTTSRIRVYVTGALNTSSCVVEVEAYTAP